MSERTSGVGAGVARGCAGLDSRRGFAQTSGMSRLAIALMTLVLTAATQGACARRTDADATAPAAGAEFRMRGYFVVVLRRGPAWSPEKSAEVEAIGKGHMAHLQQMAASGKMVLAGPFDAPSDGGVGTPAGLCIYAVETREEA